MSGFYLANDRVQLPACACRTQTGGGSLPKNVRPTKTHRNPKNDRKTEDPAVNCNGWLGSFHHIPSLGLFAEGYGNSRNPLMKR